MFDLLPNAITSREVASRSRLAMGGLHAAEAAAVSLNVRLLRLLPANWRSPG